ncbi:MAG TPA: SusF/SusE family outer membrane protein [Tenuifilaceae bacterium]|nr:SusF/SusE family outer membrane protein [Tenuifilaceae bacterium]HPE18744.1 SusF/SusE family outer membrane protein [Tenuifilaceae bacterium]HPJ46388.1 SusF/SusE family outer membrane protein [Tenuifilaceae bacterium]HPQ34895.1 SusF/SusE family outer membrane protein [Tenuifilaceae bacterium]
MKKIVIILLTMLSFALLNSCEEDQVGPTLNLSETIAPTITSPADGFTLVLVQDDQDLLFTVEWTAASYNAEDLPNISYNVVIVNPADNKSITLAVTDTLTASVTYKYLNTQLCRGFGLAYEVNANIELKVVASLSNNSTVDDVSSGSISTNLTPYEDIIVYPKLWVPGSYQNWSPADAPTIASLLFDGNYEGYVYFPTENTQFKFTSDPDWSHTNYGNGGVGVLDTDPGASNLTVTDAGYYKFNVNTNNLTWTYALTSWGIIGTAVPPYDWSEDIDMTYNVDNNVWEVTTDLEAGVFKFRANDGWDINYGEDDPTLKTLKHGGADIPVAEAGNYTITLILKNSPVYTYTIVKN